MCYLPCMAKIAPNVRWRRWREANLLSQQDMASGIGISLRSLQAIEYGECIPRKSTEQKLLTFQRKLRDGRNTNRKAREIIALQKRKKIVAMQIDKILHEMRTPIQQLSTQQGVDITLPGLGPSNPEFAARFVDGNTFTGREGTEAVDGWDKRIENVTLDNLSLTNALREAHRKERDSTV